MKSLWAAIPILLFVVTNETSALAPGEQSYSVALHQHGSLSERNGSVEWHASKAQQLGLDLIWWTDHDWRVEHWAHTRRFDFEAASVDPVTRVVSEPDITEAFYERMWIPAGFSDYSLTVVDTLATEGSQSLCIRVRDDFSSFLFRFLKLEQVGSRRQNQYSLARRVRVRFSVFPEVFDATNSRFFLEAKLSEHATETHELLYVAGTPDGFAAGTTALPVLNGQWNHYEVDLTADAIQRYTMGGADSLRAEDNNLLQLSFGVAARKGEEVILYLDDFQYVTDENLDGNAMLDKNRDFCALYESMYPGPRYHTGSEVSRFIVQPHLNAFAPGHTLVDYTGFVAADSVHYAIDQIHAQGGAVSLNHMYGPGIYFAHDEEPAEARAERVRREMVEAKAYGVDMLEVGYRIRHANTLADHLDTWDALTGNAIFVTGNGVTDSHGSGFLDGFGPWQPGNEAFENNFITWLYATDLSEAALVKPMKSGRAIFGDPYLFDLEGSLDLVTEEGFRMGKVVVTDRSSHAMVVEIDGIPASVNVRLLQGEIRENPATEYLDVNYLRDEFLVGHHAGVSFVDTVTIDTTIPSFVRVQVEEVDQDPWVFSNPIAFLPSVPADGVRAERVAASIGDVLIQEAADFRLRDVQGSGLPQELVVVGDEEILGQGTFVLDVSGIGTPTNVVGASTWNVAGNLVTVSGFQGTGSTIRVQWGAVGVGPGSVVQPTELALSAGRPNPFSQGLIAEFAMPDPASAFLEVLDVQGRRVRVLLDEWRSPGRYREAWDGRDSYGRVVADGVYFLRLSAGGQSLTTKAVKLR